MSMPLSLASLKISKLAASTCLEDIMQLISSETLVISKPDWDKILEKRFGNVSIERLERIYYDVREDMENLKQKYVGYESFKHRDFIRLKEKILQHVLNFVSNKMEQKKELEPIIQ